MNTKNRNNASSDELYVRNWHGLIFEFYIIQEYQMMFDSYEQDICPDNMTAVELYKWISQFSHELIVSRDMNPKFTREEKRVSRRAYEELKEHILRD